jgi:two-component system CheB/CheR fusion protein
MHEGDEISNLSYHSDLNNLASPNPGLFMPKQKKFSLKKEAEKVKDSSPVRKPPAKSSLLHCPFPVVGIGASAGGLEAVLELLKHLPSNTGLAYVLIQHLAPDHESILPRILARHTQMSVSEARNNQQIEPDHLYVIPPNASMTLKGRMLKLAPRRKIAGRLRCIDFFLESLAENCRGSAVALILSGTDFDGSAGVEAIKNEGGLTFAQDEGTAKFDSMPRNAAATGCIDAILTPPQMAAELERLAAKLGSVVEPAFQSPEIPKDEGLDKISNLLQARKKINFSLYKPNTFRRRVFRRLMLSRMDGFASYFEHLRKHPEELDVLYQDILINVTRFFRDPETFDVLKEQVFPKMVAERPSNEPLRIWTAGCSMGQEPYSIAMAFLEYTAQIGRHIPLQIFATDLNETILEKARAAYYTQSQVQELSHERLRRFFIQEDGGFRICKPIREMCIFARHDLVGDPPFSRMDLVSCRNLLIYFEPSLQKKAIPVFHYALKPEGFLLLGSSETVGEFSDLFKTENKTHKIYLKKAGATRPRLSLAGFSNAVHSGHEQNHPAPPVQKAPEQDASKAADRYLLGRYSPVGVVINNDFEIIQFRGSTSPYLEPPSGKASFHLLKMAREGLLMPLRTLLGRAKKGNDPVRREGIVVRDGKRNKTIGIEVVPLGGAKDRNFLVLFEPATSSTPEQRRLAEEDLVRRKSRSKDAASEIIRLQNELGAVKEYLQTVVEQSEMVNEELQASNEESQSSNEELQSINEELETTKEELESTNEELQTVNDEMNNRNVELHRINSDLNNVLNGVQMCIVVLGADLCIRRFTPLAEKVLNLVPTDTGRPITNIKPNIDFPELERFILESIDEMKTKHAEVQDREGKWYSLRTLPYRTIDNKIDGAVMVLVDIDATKRSEERVQQALDYARRTLETVREPLAVLDSRMRIESVNPSFYRTFQISPEETIGKVIYEIGQLNIPRLRLLLEQVFAKDASFDDFEIDHDFDRIGRRVLLLNARRVTGDGPPRILLALEDITQRKIFEQARDQAVAASQAKDKFLAALSHELRTPLSPVMLIASDSAADESLPKEVRRNFSIILQNVEMEARLIDDLLDLTLISRGKLSLSMSRLDIHAVIRDAILIVQADMKGKDIELKLHLDAEHSTVMGDSIRLRQVFLNVLKNAVKFTPKKGVITVETAVLPDGKEMAVRLSDTGIGMSAAEIGRIFNAFTQGDHAEMSHSNKFGGLGLGLAIAETLVKNHSGRIRAESAGKGKGTSFVIELPLLSEMENAAPVKPAK